MPSVSLSKAGSLKAARFPSSRSRTRGCSLYAYCRLLGAANSNFLSLPPSRPRPSFPVPRQPGGASPEAMGDVGCKEWGSEGGTQQLVLRHPLPAGGQGTGSLLSPRPPSTRSPPFLPPSPRLLSPSPSPLKRAGSALAPSSRRTVRAGGAVSLSCTQRPARQSGKPAETECVEWQRQRRHRQPRQPQATRAA